MSSPGPTLPTSSFAYAAAVKPSRTRSQISIVGYAIVAVVAAVLLDVADEGGLRIGMILVLISASLGIVLAVHHLRRRR